MNLTHRTKATRGLTLVELMATLAVSSVMLGSVLPDFSRLVQRQRLEGAAAQLETELQYARSQAVADGRSVRFSFRADAAQSCYVIHTGSANACRCDGVTTVCAGNAQALRTVSYEAANGLRVSSNSSSFLFDPTKGTVTPTATMTLSNARGDSLKLVVNIMGRVRDCSPTGLRGHKPC